MQNDCAVLKERLEQYDSMPIDLKKRFRIILIDDCSPKQIILPRVNLNMTLLRVLEDIPWNQNGARNLGICYATTNKIFLTDIDHFIHQSTVEFAEHIQLAINEVYFFKRIKNNEQIRTHPNTFLIKKDFFMRMNLYDEDFVGNYGHDDTFIRTFSFVKHNAIVQYSDLAIEVYQQKEHNLLRDTKINMEKLKNKNGEHSKIILRFPWEFIEETKCI
jgi:hypothetical protein